MRTAVPPSSAESFQVPLGKSSDKLAVRTADSRKEVSARRGKRRQRRRNQSYLARGADL